MAFTGSKDRVPKADRARLLGLALAVLLLKGGERVGLLPDMPPRMGRAQLEPLTLALAADDATDFGTPPTGAIPARSQAVFLSDFLGPTEELERTVAHAVAQRVRGVLVQILDPVEEEFPYQGRSIFESMSGALRHETLRANDLQARYRDRLAARKRCPCGTGAQKRLADPDPSHQPTAQPCADGVVANLGRGGADGDDRLCNPVAAGGFGRAACVVVAAARCAARAGGAPLSGCCPAIGPDRHAHGNRQKPRGGCCCCAPLPWPR